jgi:predicted lipid-binding transport protein (Tim44 family)
MRRILLSIGLVGLGGGGGYLLAAPDAPPPAAQVGHDRVERVPVAVGDGPSEAALRRIVHDELASAPGQVGSGAAGAAPAAPATPPGNPVAFGDGMRRVDQAIAQRRWTRDDAAALGRALDPMSPDQRTTVLRTLIPAINRGEVKLAYRGELF